jgi:hypothetical protein
MGGKRRLSDFRFVEAIEQGPTQNPAPEALIMARFRRFMIYASAVKGFSDLVNNFPRSFIDLQGPSLYNRRRAQTSSTHK